MNPKEIKELIEFLIEKDISEFELERGDVKMRMKRGRDAQIVTTSAPAYPPAAYMPTPVAPPAPLAGAVTGPESVAPTAPVSPAPAPAPPADETGLHTVRSPIVGTFYEAPSPGAPPFVKVGDTVRAGQVLCIIEAMKLMNEIEADVAGTIVKRFVENGQPVEYGQPLFNVRPA